jgi:plasmid maintenance system antidote protein VapI
MLSRWLKYTKKGDKKSMTNTKLLEEAIEQSGLKKGKIAERLGLSRAGLSNLINGRAEFRASQILVLSDMLGLSDAERDAIFFAEFGG